MISSFMRWEVKTTLFRGLLAEDMASERSGHIFKNSLSLCFIVFAITWTISGAFTNSHEHEWVDKNGLIDRQVAEPLGVAQSGGWENWAWCLLLPPTCYVNSSQTLHEKHAEICWVWTTDFTHKLSYLLLITMLLITTDTHIGQLAL